MAKPQILTQNEDFLTALDGNFTLIVFSGRTDATGVAASEALLSRALEGSPEGIYVLTVVEENAPTPDAETRERIAAMLAAHARGIRASAVVFEGTGFRAAAVRAVVTGVNMVTRQSFPHKVFANVREAAQWLTRQFPSGGRAPRDIQQAVAAVRR